MGFWAGMARATGERADRNERQDVRDAAQDERDKATAWQQKMFDYRKKSDNAALKRQGVQDGYDLEDRTRAELEREHARRMGTAKLIAAGGGGGAGTARGSTGSPAGGSGTLAQQSQLGLKTLSGLGASNEVLTEFAGHGSQSVIEAATTYQDYLTKTKDYLSFTPVTADEFLAGALAVSTPGTTPDLNSVMKAMNMDKETFEGPAYGDDGITWKEIMLRSMSTPPSTSVSFPSTDSTPTGMDRTEINAVLTATNSGVKQNLSIQLDNLRKELTVLGPDVSPEKSAVSTEIALVQEAMEDLKNGNPVAAISYTGANAILSQLSGTPRALDFINQFGGGYRNAIQNVTFSSDEEATFNPNIKVGDWYVVDEEIKQKTSEAIKTEFETEEEFTAFVAKYPELIGKLDTITIGGVTINRGQNNTKLDDTELGATELNNPSVLNAIKGSSGVTETTSAMPEAMSQPQSNAGKVAQQNIDNASSMSEAMSQITEDEYEDMTRIEKRQAGLPVGGLNLRYAKQEGGSFKGSAVADTPVPQSNARKVAQENIDNASSMSVAMSKITEEEFEVMTRIERREAGLPVKSMDLMYAKQEGGSFRSSAMTDGTERMIAPATEAGAFIPKSNSESENLINNPSGNSMAAPITPRSDTPVDTSLDDSQALYDLVFSDRAGPELIQQAMAEFEAEHGQGSAEAAIQMISMRQQ